jgi:hypothetical protein
VEHFQALFLWQMEACVKPIGGRVRLVAVEYLGNSTTQLCGLLIGSKGDVDFHHYDYESYTGNGNNDDDYDSCCSWCLEGEWGWFEHLVLVWAGMQGFQALFLWQMGARVSPIRGHVRLIAVEYSSVSPNNCAVFPICYLFTDLSIL